MINMDEVDYLIEVRGIYDGWSVARMKDGTLINRWAPEDRRHASTQEWIDRMNLSDAGAREG